MKIMEIDQIVRAANTKGDTVRSICYLVEEVERRTVEKIIRKLEEEYGAGEGPPEVVRKLAEGGL